MAINFRGRINVKYFMQTQFLQFFKNNAKVSSLKITTKNNYYINTFSPCEEEDTNTVDWTSNKQNTKGLKTLHLNTER